MVTCIGAGSARFASDRPPFGRTRSDIIPGSGTTTPRRCRAVRQSVRMGRSATRVPFGTDRVRTTHPEEVVRTVLVR